MKTKKTVQGVALLAATVFVGWLGWTAYSLMVNSSKPVDAYLVLGGSPLREAFGAALVRKHPEAMVLISGGSTAPHLAKIFHDMNAPVDRAFVEVRAKSTFENFFYSLPILLRHNCHKVGVITSEGNEQRALVMARILFWFHGVSVQNEILPFENSLMGHDESVVKTALDATRSLLWAPLSLVIYPDSPPLALAEQQPSQTIKNIDPALEQQYIDYLDGKFKGVEEAGTQ